MQSKIFFRASSGTDYELIADHDPDRYVPRYLVEDEKGRVQDLMTDRGWGSLPEMTQDLKVEIVSWGSDIGD